MLSPVDIASWTASMLDSLREVTVAIWECDTTEILPVPRRIPKGTPGSYVALVGQNYNFKFGIAASWEHCELLSRRFLFLEDSDEVSESDMADVMNEITNIVGGGVKRRMSDFDLSLRLGLPAFFEGPITPTADQESAYAQAVVGEIPLYLVALKHILPA